MKTTGFINRESPKALTKQRKNRDNAKKDREKDAGKKLKSIKTAKKPPAKRKEEYSRTRGLGTAAEGLKNRREKIKKQQRSIQGQQRKKKIRKRRKKA